MASGPENTLPNDSPTSFVHTALAEMVSIHEKTLGPEHPMTRTLLDNYQDLLTQMNQ